MLAFRVAASAVTTACFVSVALLYVPAGTAQTGAPATAASATRVSPRFGVLSRRTLRLLEEQLVKIGTPVIDEPHSVDWPHGDVKSQGLAVEAAKAAYQHARRSREAAEVALKEYAQVAGKREQAALEEELKVARADHEKAVPRIEQARARLAMIVPMLNESTGALATRWRLEAVVEVARLEEVRTRYLVKGTASKLKALEGYERPKRIKELQSEVQKTLSDELGRQATMELEQAKLAVMERAFNGRPPLSTHETRILALLRQAIPIEEKWSAKLGEMKEDQEPSESLRKEIVGLTGQLQAIVDEAVAVENAAAWESFRSKF
jgi:hypothetical protein